jgi:cobalt-zinc-cadmium efflux system membrane fusion protein
MKNLIYTLFFSVPFLFSCSSKDAVKVEPSAELSTSVILNADQIRNSEIKIGMPTNELIGVTIYANGMIEVPPQNKTVIAAKFGGFIKSLSVLDGMAVKKGQVLFTIEDPQLIQLQQDYLEVNGNLEYLEAELERQKILVSQEAGNLKSLQLAKSQYTVAISKKAGLKAKLEMAGINMNQLNNGILKPTVSVTSPFNGVVTKLEVNVGSYANPTDHLLEIIDLKHAHAEVIVFEKDIKQLKIGQMVNLMLSNKEEPVEASVFLIGREIGKDRTVKVHCHLKNENKDLIPGSYFKASVYTGEKKHYCLPSEAIVELNGKNVVFFETKKGKGSASYVPEEVRVISVNNGKSAIEYKNKARSYLDSVVITGAYNIMSAILIKGEE